MNLLIGLGKLWVNDCPAGASNWRKATVKKPKKHDSWFYPTRSKYFNDIMIKHQCNLKLKLDCRPFQIVGKERQDTAVATQLSWLKISKQQQLSDN